MIQLHEGDITTLPVDIIVNAANSSMRGGGGVDGAIHRAAGQELREFLIRRCPYGAETGDALISPGFGLQSSYVIHTVGPIVGSLALTDQDREFLRMCYYNCMIEAARISWLRSLNKAAIEPVKIAFCCISTGIYGYPHEDAANTAIPVVEEMLSSSIEISVSKQLLEFFDYGNRHKDAMISYATAFQGSSDEDQVTATFQMRDLIESVIFCVFTPGKDSVDRPFYERYLIEKYGQVNLYEFPVLPTSEESGGEDSVS